MEIRELIINTAKNRDEVKVANIVEATGFSRVYIHRFFKKLVEEGRLAKFGHANKAVYVLANDKRIENVRRKFWSFTRIFKNKKLDEDKILEVVKKETGIMDGLPENVKNIVEYSFTEMVNNAIDHSKSDKIKVEIKRDSAAIRFDVIDWGIGIFENLIHSRHLSGVDEAIQDLLKGKQTTVPEAHSGEGIFFTRRAGDTFLIRSSAKQLFFNNVIEDFTVAPIGSIVGTKITFTIGIDTKRKLREIFNAFSTEDFDFGKTEVSVKLYNPGGTKDFISRSQARRILVGLDKFKKIVLDFKGISSVGQGFADEIFRVFYRSHPEIKIESINMNDEVGFMIRRAKSEKN